MSFVWYKSGCICSRILFPTLRLIIRFEGVGKRRPRLVQQGGTGRKWESGSNGMEAAGEAAIMTTARRVLVLSLCLLQLSQGRGAAPTQIMNSLDRHNVHSHAIGSSAAAFSACDHLPRSLHIARRCVSFTSPPRPAPLLMAKSGFKNGRLGDGKMELRKQVVRTRRSIRASDSPLDTLTKSADTADLSVDADDDEVMSMMKGTDIFRKEDKVRVFGANLDSKVASRGQGLQDYEEKQVPKRVMEELLMQYGGDMEAAKRELR